jgi:hypothetical protein
MGRAAGDDATLGLPDAAAALAAGGTIAAGRKGGTARSGSRAVGTLVGSGAGGVVASSLRRKSDIFAPLVIRVDDALG